MYIKFWKLLKPLQNYYKRHGFKSHIGLAGSTSPVKTVKMVVQP